MFRNISIRRKVFFLTFSFCAVSLTSNIYLAQSEREISVNYSSLLRQSDSNVSMLLCASNSLGNMLDIAQKIAHEQNGTQNKNDVLAYWKLVQKTDSYFQIMSSEKGMNLYFLSFINKFNDVKNSIEKSINSNDINKSKIIIDNINLGRKLQFDLSILEKSFQLSAQQRADFLEAAAWSDIRLCGWAAGITLIVFVLVSALMGYREIAWPLLRLRDRTLAIAQGEFSVSVEEEKRRDEIGAMAAALEEIRLKLQGGREDILTSLANRTALQDMMRSALALSDVASMVALIYLDLDNFKQINDRYGHGAGDELLRLVAQRLRLNVGANDLVARLGGDEFVVFCSSCADEEAVMDMAARIAADLSLCEELPFGQVAVSASVGVAIAMVGDVTPERLLRHADCAMYAAKSTGKGCCAVYEPWMLDEAERRQKYEQALRRSVETNEFHLVYQPVIDWRTKRVMSFEALLRWEHPELGSVPPSDFISIAEEIGAVFAIDCWVMKTACQEAAKWPDDLILSVNVSPTSFVEDDLLESIYTALKESQLPPERLEIEITETAMIEDLPGVHAVVTALRSLGVKVAIDDLGVGYSSLSFLRSIPVTRVKMDKSFIAELGRVEAAQAIIQGVVVICHELSIALTAEGVETAMQMAALQSIGCTQHQGYYISRPLSAEDVLPFVASFSVRTVPSLHECLQGTWGALRVEALSTTHSALA
ncbi:putative bifunctional diguanylate cyclase/phosphodiesterase [Neokomagataea anthophila]|uniref:EAL domain-containing protein n=1 Tax=Neokomagataea anthophila TaxID=2826925 RepID=A0ABS5E4L3_9PROT|nr:EAL domain-containing protein [Neokomagataea anthophila]MBR0558845.1 EAL domain-containing protein [Neokomagataea anthophila]